METRCSHDAEGLRNGSEELQRHTRHRARSSNGDLPLNIKFTEQMKGPSTSIEARRIAKSNHSMCIRRIFQFHDLVMVFQLVDGAWRRQLSKSGAVCV